MPPCLVKLEVSRDFVDDDGVLEILGGILDARSSESMEQVFFAFSHGWLGCLAGSHELRETFAGEVALDRGERCLGKLVTCSRPIDITGIIHLASDIMPEEKLRLVHRADDAAVGALRGDHGQSGPVEASTDRSVRCFDVK